MILNNIDKLTVLNNYIPEPIIPVDISKYVLLDQLKSLSTSNIIEIYGEDSVGKTTLALELFKLIGDTCAIIDTEHSLDDSLLVSLDIDLESVSIFRPIDIEQTDNIFRTFVDVGVDVIIFDSLSAYGSNSKYQASKIARLFKNNIYQILNNGIKIICINQLRQKIDGDLGGTNDVTIANEYMRYIADTRLHLKRTKLIKEENNVIGHKCILKNIKCEQFDFETIKFDIIYGNGVQNINI